MGHDHHHGGSNLKIAFFLNLAFTIFEIIGGFYTNSIAIISDALHDLGDSLSLGTAWYLENKSKQKADEKFSFGYARFSLLGALINSLVLLAGSFFVISEALNRFMEPKEVNAQGMIFFAIVGIAVNGYAAWKLSSGKSLNERVASWHLLEDVLGWVAVLVVAVILLIKPIPYLDPALSIVITLYILWNVVKRLRQTLFIFLQGRPSDVNANEIEEKLLEIEGVDSIHHTHIWSLEGQHHVFTSHVKLKNIKTVNQILDIKNRIKEILSEYPFKHYNIETELDNETCGLENNLSNQGRE